MELLLAIPLGFCTPDQLRQQIADFLQKCLAAKWREHMPDPIMVLNLDPVGFMVSGNLWERIGSCRRHCAAVDGAPADGHVHASLLEFRVAEPQA